MDLARFVFLLDQTDGQAAQEALWQLPCAFHHHPPVVRFCEHQISTLLTPHPIYRKNKTPFWGIQHLLWE